MKVLPVSDLDVEESPRTPRLGGSSVDVNQSGPSTGLKKSPSVWRASSMRGSRSSTAAMGYDDMLASMGATLAMQKDLDPTLMARDVDKLKLRLKQQGACLLNPRSKLMQVWPLSPLHT
jgi:hypothetical protein